MSENTTYYVRAYATNSVGTSYGNELSFISEVAIISGYVFYASTEIPVSGVMISVDSFSASTGSDGYYEIINIPVGTSTLIAEKDGYDTYSTTLTFIPGINNLNIEMTSAAYTHNLFGIISDELTGDPISFVDVNVLNPDGTESDLKTQSSSSGYYQIPTVPQGSRTITFTHDEFDTSQINIFMANSDYELDFQMTTCLPVALTGYYAVIYPLQVDINGDLTSFGCTDVTQHGHCWSIYSNPTIDNDKTELGSPNNLGNYTSEAKFLLENTQYHARAYAINSYGTFYGEDIVFTTTSFPDCGTINYEGKTYETVVIGNQCWMRENLNFETNSGSFCYGNVSSNCQTYGRLYNWYTMMNGESSSNNVPSGVQGICPDEWHIPSDAEWDILTDYLGGSYNGGKMKETGTAHWFDPNAGANNMSGFTALAGGGKILPGSSVNMGKRGIFWSSTLVGTRSDAWCRMLIYTSSQIQSYEWTSGNSNSVRCVKD